jgi:hypothetical protein
LNWREFGLIILAAAITIFVGASLNYFHLIKIQFTIDNISKLITIFVIANSLFSIATPIVLERKSLFGRRKYLLFSLILLWIAVLIGLVEILIITDDDPTSEKNRATSYLMQAGIGIWIIGIFSLLRTVWIILTLDTIKFNKNNFVFKYEYEKRWGTNGINKKLEQSKITYYPIIVLADENTRPWKILQNFIVSGLTFSNKIGCIYFTFTRPASEILDQLCIEDGNIFKGLEKKKSELAETDQEKTIIGDVEPIWKNIIFIDCYTLASEQNSEIFSLNKKINGMTPLYSNPNDPHHLNAVYEEALKILKGRKCEVVRVAYDAISDFLSFTDSQLATQYLRHNMGFEQRQKISSLYLFRKNTIEELKENYFLWFANGVLKMEHDNNSNIKVEFRGPFSIPQQFYLDYKFDLIDWPRTSDAPMKLEATTISSSQIKLSWFVPNNNGGTIVIGYEIERRLATANVWNVLVENTGSTNTTYLDIGLLPNTQYYYRISAINSVGIGSASEIAIATTDV